MSGTVRRGIPSGREVGLGERIAQRLLLRTVHHWKSNSSGERRKIAVPCLLRLPTYTVGHSEKKNHETHFVRSWILAKPHISIDFEHLSTGSAD